MTGMAAVLIVSFLCCLSLCDEVSGLQKRNATTDYWSLLNSSTISDTHHDRRWPIQRRCFRVPSIAPALTVGRCRETLRDINSHLQKNFNRPYPFQKDRSPKIGGVTPPFRFNNPQDDCELFIDVGTDHEYTRAIFTFADVRREAQNILQECSDSGPGQGGMGPVNSVPGWYVEISRVGQPNQLASSADDTNLNITPGIVPATPHHFLCYTQYNTEFVADFQRCELSLRLMRRSVPSTVFYRDQNFEMYSRPTVPGKPPTAFHAGPCIIGLRTGHDHTNVVGRFSYRQARDVAYDILSHCGHDSRGGIAPVGQPFGWMVDVYGAPPPGRPDIDVNPPVMATNVANTSIVGVPASTISSVWRRSENTTSLGQIWCSTSSIDTMPLSKADCKPVLDVLKKLPESSHSVAFEWGHQPWVDGYHFPPFTFTKGRCQIRIDTHTPSRIERFSFFYAAALAEEVMQRCKVSQSYFYGGFKTLRTSDGWFVSVGVNDEHRIQPKLNVTAEIASSDVAEVADPPSMNLSSPNYRINCHDGDRRRRSINYNLCKTSIDQIKDVAQNTFNLKQRFVFNRRPDVRRQGYPIRYPPFVFSHDGDCYVHLDTYHREDEDSFRWRDVWQTAKNVLHYCIEEEGKHFGGKTLIGSKQSWYVEIYGARIEEAVGLLGSNASVDLTSS